MTVLVSDSFNRTNNPTSLGTADTGQVWSQVGGIAGSWGINANSALWTWNPFDGIGRVIIESGVTNALTKVTLANATSGPQNFGVGEGLMCRYVDINYNWRLVYFKFPGPANQLRLQRTYAGLTTTAIDLAVTLADNDTISVGACGRIFEVFINDVSQGTYDDTANPHNYGTLCGLVGIPGSFFSTITKHFDDFSVATQDSCPNSEASWIIPPIVWSAEATVSPSSITGTPIKRFDAGEGGAASSSWWMVPQLSDSGAELRDKVIKAVRLTGKFTAANFKVYGYGATEELDIASMEAGTNSRTGAVTVPDSTGVRSTQRFQVNVPGSALHTVRIEGVWDGSGIKDRIDEIEYEIAEQGVRR